MLRVVFMPLHIPRQTLLSLVGAIVLLCMVPGALVHAGVAGEGMHKEIKAIRALNSVLIDGSLKDDVWQRAPVHNDFTQQFPIDGATPSVETRIQVAFDEEHLYIAVQSLDNEPEKISAPLGRRDSLASSDYVEIHLDTRHDHDNGYVFRINAGGVLADAEIHDDQRQNLDWDAVWNAKARTDSTGWSAEFAIPLSILRFSAEEEPRFGFNVKRVVHRSHESMQWIHVPRTASGNLSRAGHIVGLAGIKPKRTIELRPFGLARLESELSAGGSAMLGDAHSTGELNFGIDAKVGLTDGLTLDTTINSDFGQVEADPVVLNLTSFETFFPEKRPFFLEGAGMFNTDIRMIHSRRVGERTTRFGRGSTVTLSDGSEHTVQAAPLFVPIYAAARVSGDIGARFKINALSAITGPERVEIGDSLSRTEVSVAPPRSYSAVRGKYAFQGSSYLGFVATSVARLGTSMDPEANHDAFSESIDGRWVRSDGMYRAYFQFATAHRSGGDRFEVGDKNCPSNTCRPLTRADGSIQQPGDVGVAGEVGGSKAGGAYQMYGRYRFISPRFDVDDMGFENNWDFHQVFLTNSLQQEEPFLWFQRAEVSANALAEIGFDGSRRNLTFNNATSLLGNNFWTGVLTFDYKPPGSWSTRETSDAALFETSDEARAMVDITTDSRRDYSGGFGAERVMSPSTELNVTSGYAYVSLRPKPTLELSLKTEVERRIGDLRVVDCVSDGGGDCWQGSLLRHYTLALQDSNSLDVSARANVTISTDLSIESYLQLFAADASARDYSVISNQEGKRPRMHRSEADAIPGFDGDSDGDGHPDGNFSFATINANVVLRWEMFQGTTMMVVYTRAQRHQRLKDRLAFAGLRRSPGEEILLVKLTLFSGL
jgi:hypothetical protein